jgi:AraC family transcriptional regulator, arabinose operon regulatory protein
MDPRITWATTELERRLAEPVTVAQLAAAVNLSPSRFAHLFRAETGVSPMRYLHTQRMRRARLLLERTFLTVKQVMGQVGCGDPSHFARDFRRFHGLAPSECRGAASGPRHEPPPESELSTRP